MVSNAFVAINAGLAFFLRLHVFLVRRLFLQLRRHGLKAVAVAAFARVAVFHALPLMGGQRHPLRLELLLGVYHPRELAPDLKTRFGFANHLVGPVLGHVTVRTDCPHPRAIGVVNGLFVLLVDVVSHFVTRNTKFQLIGHLKARVESPPENNTSNKTHTRERQNGILGTGLFKYFPKTLESA